MAYWVDAKLSNVYSSDKVFILNKLLNKVVTEQQIIEANQLYLDELSNTSQVQPQTSNMRTKLNFVDLIDLISLFP